MLGKSSMSMHKCLARGLLRTADGRARAKRFWEEVSHLLNYLGGSLKTVQHRYGRTENIAKKNAAAIRRMNMATGGGRSSASTAQWELRVLDIMGEGFGEPQTTACVPAFPTINIDEKMAQYEIQPEEGTQPEVQFFNESSGFVCTSAAVS